MKIFLVILGQVCIFIFVYRLYTVDKENEKPSTAQIVFLPVCNCFIRLQSTNDSEVYIVLLQLIEWQNPFFKS